MTDPQTVRTVTDIVSRVGKIPRVGERDDIFEAGMSSISSLELLLELEGEFGVSIPDGDFIEARTPLALAEMVTRLRAAESR